MAPSIPVDVVPTTITDDLVALNLPYKVLVLSDLPDSSSAMAVESGLSSAAKELEEAKARQSEVNLN